MKNLIAIFSVLTFLTSISVQAKTKITEVLAPIDHVYSPMGFDSNDSTEVVISGYLPNLCHKSIMTKVNVKGKKIDIKVTTLKYDIGNTQYCAEMIVPFVETVNIGLLDKGLYEILVNGKSPYEKESNIKVSEAVSNAVDEFAYARVDYIEKEEGTRTVTLKGYNPSDCFVFDKIEVVNNGKDVYSVLPKMKQVSDFCPMKMIPFNYKMEVPTNLKAKKVLLHVRSLEGKSVNSIFYNR